MPNQTCGRCGGTDGFHTVADCPNDTPNIPGDDGTRVYHDSYSGNVRELTADDLETLRSLRYPSLDPTGVQVIDDLLLAIGWAGKWMHDSSRWGETNDMEYGPLREGENFSDLIQSLANDGADEIRKALLR